MPSDLQVWTISTPGGINQSAPRPQPDHLEELKNFATFRGRIGLRPPLKVLMTVQDDQGTPADVTAILDITDHNEKIYVASYSSNTNKVYLHSADVDGSNLTLEDTLWSSVMSKPRVTLTSFEGGSATSGEARLYAADYDQTLDTKYWNGTSVSTLTEDLDNDSSAENIKFSLMIPYKFHLWGTGFFEGTTLRESMLRFSQPGLIPGTDDAGGSNPKEWHSADHRSVGKRGDKIVALSKAGDRLLVFQRRALHAIFGSGSGTWTRQEISDITGAVGPGAVTSVDNRIAYFWSQDGPYMTDGNQLIYIGEPIRQLAVSVDSAEDDTQVGYSPDDGMVYFIVSLGGEDEYSLGLAFDHRAQRWMKEVWLVGSSTNAEIGALSFLDGASSPGPEGDPSGLSATAQDDVQIDLSWTNGDTNVNTETHVYRSTSSGFSPDDATNKVATLSPGVSSYSDTGLSQDTTYYYLIRHYRNGQHSNATSEASDTTWLAEPSAISLSGLVDGNKIDGTNNATGADVVIERRTGVASFSAITTLTTPGTSFTYSDTGLNCGLEYDYRFKAKKAGSTDSEYTATYSRRACEADSAPSTPGSLTATKVDHQQIDLSWIDVANADEYEIYRNDPPGAKLIIHDSIDTTTASYSDTGLDPETEYTYAVKACNAAGCSDPSNTDSATTDPAP